MSERTGGRRTDRFPTTRPRLPSTVRVAVGVVSGDRSPVRSPVPPPTPRSDDKSRHWRYSNVVRKLVRGGGGFRPGSGWRSRCAWPAGSTARPPSSTTRGAGRRPRRRPTPPAPRPSRTPALVADGEGEVGERGSVAGARRAPPRSPRGGHQVRLDVQVALAQHQPDGEHRLRSPRTRTNQRRSPETSSRSTASITGFCSSCSASQPSIRDSSSASLSG